MDGEKKSLVARERDEVDRVTWLSTRLWENPRDFVIVDETSTWCFMTRQYGRAPRGQPTTGCVTRNRGTATTLLASMSAAGMGPAMPITGATSGPVFVAYLRDLLAPTLRPGQIVLLDNVGAHLAREVAGLIAERGARLVYLPAYSPDLSPIEYAFSKVKGLLRRASAQTPAALEQAIADALNAITTEDIDGYFRHCGFDLSSGQDL